jgi:dTDP-4-dehydrorhamnose reductase
MKIVLIGANGQLGSDLKRILDSANLVCLTHQDIEVTDYEKVSRVIKSHSPDILINTSAYHKVDECEGNPERSFQVNALGVRNLALTCKECGSTLVHFSTDYIFNGRKKEPYIEEDIPNPLNVYGISKLAGEYFAKYILDRYFLIRTSGLFGIAGARGKGGNFIETMLKLADQKKEIKVVEDQVFSPTYTLDLARKIKELISTTSYGTYHITNRGCCSWYEFAEKIFQLSGIEVNLKKTRSREFAAPADRPKYSVLGNYNLEKMGRDDLQTWNEALEDYLERRRE